MRHRRLVRVFGAHGPRNTQRADVGQILPLVALLVVLAGACVLLLGRLGGLAAGRAQARTAADAAALAGAADGEEAALRLAEANGAAVDDYRVDGADTELRAYVDLGGGRHLDAVARARRTGAPFAVVGGGDRAGLAPAMVAALARAEQLLGEPVPVVSGFRSAEEQRALWANRDRNPYPVARPGSSMHERGLAIDVPAWFVPHLARVAKGSGLCRPLPVTDPIHFEVCAGRP